MIFRRRHLTIITNFPNSTAQEQNGLQAQLPVFAKEAEVPRKEALRRARLAVETVNLAFNDSIVYVGDEQAHDFNRKILDKNKNLILMVQVWK